MDNFLSFLRAALTMIGAFFIGKNIFGTAVDANVWQSVISGLVIVATLVWSILDKTANIEMWQSAIRTVVTFGAGLMFSKGIITADQATKIIAGAVAVLPFIYGWLSKKKSAMLAAGTLQVSQLKKAA